MPPSNLSERLVYRRDEEWLALPSWASFLVGLGGDLAEPETPGPALVGIVLPIRDYAALLMASGTVMHRASPMSEEEANTRFWEWQADLPPGTPVRVVRRDGRLVDGVIDDHTIESGRPGTWVRTTKDGRQWISAGSTSRIQPSDKAAPSFKRNPQRRRIRHAADFVATLFPDQNPALYASTREPGCVICGTISTLEAELTAAGLGAGLPAAAIAPGTLQDILRVRRLVGHEEAFRTELVAASASKPGTLNYAVHTAIFDGALAFVKHRHRWRSACRIAVLSETDPHLPEAVDVLKEAASAPGQRGLSLQALDAIPMGCEVVSFRAGAP